MKTNNDNLVVLGVAAHPDDLDAGAGGTFAKWAKSGAKCYYLICTDGSKGSVDPKINGKKLIETRRKEQRAAGRVLGLKDVFFLNYKDTELEPNMKLKKEIVWYIRKLKPDIVVTTDPTFIYRNGYINHSDHRAAGLATIDAIYPLAKNQHTFEEFKKDGIMPHKVTSLYIINFMEGGEIIDISKTIKLKINALKQHKTQALGRNPEQFIERISKMIGEKGGFKYGESFVKIDFR